MSDPTNRPLAGRVAIVSGASAGIGEATAHALAELGASLVLNARRGPRLARVADSVRARAADGAVVSNVIGDAVEDTTIEALFHAAVRDCGAPASIVVVNAGRGLRGSPLTSDPAQWEEILRVNVLGAARLIRAAAQAMLKDAASPAPAASASAGTKSKSKPRSSKTSLAEQAAHANPASYAPPAPEKAEIKYSSPAAFQQAKAAADAAPRDWPHRPRDIVILSSSVGRNISPFSSMYGSTKFAVTSLAEATRRELSPRGIRVSCVHPAVVRSEFQEVAGYDPLTFGEFMERIGPTLTPEDVARTICFIVSQPAGVCLNDVMIRPTRQEYP